MLKSRVPHAKLGGGPRWRLPAIIGIACLLVTIGTIAVLSSRASSYADTILSIADTNGGFLNGIQALDSRSGASLGVAAIDVPTLPGCSAAQPKAYLNSMTVDQARGLLYVSLKACAGGALPLDRAIARIDLKTIRFLGFAPGPAGSRVIPSSQLDIVYAVRSDGLELSVVNARLGSIVKSYNFTTPVSRSGADETTGDLVTLTTAGVMERFTPSGVRSGVLQSTLAYPLQPQAPDGAQIISVGGNWYSLGRQGNQSVLARITAGGTTTIGVESEAVSLTATKDNQHIFIQTACASGVNCVANPNRMYSYNIVSGGLDKAGQETWFPLQQGGSQVRFNVAGDRLFFDGVVAGASGVGQRFVFPVDTNGSLPSGARIAVPSAVWVIADLNDSGQLTSAPPVTVPSPVPGGGGIGLSNGTIATTPVPLDQIEQALGISLSTINFDLVTDAQIRAYGYDPAMVRKYVAQLKLEQAKTSAGTGVANGGLCSGVSAGSGIDLAAIEKQLGIPLGQIDFSKVSDDEIKKFGYEPSLVRDYVAKSKSSQSLGDSCANVFTQDGFTSTKTVDPASIAAGSAANVTAQTTFDLLKGGWVITLRWQAPGGAEKFRVYGRDNGKHKLEQQLAIVDQYTREVSFGGFKQLALPPIYDQTFWFSVVPQLGEGKLGTPAAIKTRVRCIVLCRAEKI